MKPDNQFCQRRRRAKRAAQERAHIQLHHGGRSRRELAQFLSRPRRRRDRLSPVVVMVIILAVAALGSIGR